MTIDEVIHDLDTAAFPKSESRQFAINILREHAREQNDYFLTTEISALEARELEASECAAIQQERANKLSVELDALCASVRKIDDNWYMQVDELKKDVEVLCAEVERLASYERQVLYASLADSDKVDEWMQKHRPAHVVKIMERWREKKP